MPHRSAGPSCWPPPGLGTILLPLGGLCGFETSRGLCADFASPPQALLVYNIIKYQPSEYGTYRFPTWAEALGILMGLFSCLMIPAGMLVAVLREEGTLWEVGGPRAPQKCWGGHPKPGQGSPAVCCLWGAKMGSLVWGGHGSEGFCFGGAAVWGHPRHHGGVPLLKGLVLGCAVEPLAACSLPSSLGFAALPRLLPTVPQSLLPSPGCSPRRQEPGHGDTARSHPAARCPLT